VLDRGDSEIGDALPQCLLCPCLPKFFWIMSKKLLRIIFCTAVVSTVQHCQIGADPPLLALFCRCYTAPEGAGPPSTAAGRSSVHAQWQPRKPECIGELQVHPSSHLRVNVIAVFDVFPPCCACFQHASICQASSAIGALAHCLLQQSIM
jgi:hypothetical protein